VTLHLREEESELLNEWQLRSIITKYSDHIALPVLMPVQKFSEDKDAPPTIEEERINQAAALWARPKQDITEEEYKEFYKHVGHDFEDPLVWTHNRVEGKLEYTSLLFIPARAPFDLWDREQRHGVKLYVQRVFIMDDAEHLMPRYLRFVRGVIDSNDLPLNVSRELLQGSKVVDGIRAGAVKKVLGLLEDLAANDGEKYGKFWKEFGRALKEGPAEDYGNREQIAKLLRFASTHLDTADQAVALADYIGRMKDGQDKIYYITADSFAAAKNSPHLEIFRKKGLEVLLLNDRVDEWLMSHLTEFEGKSFQSVAKGALDLDKIASEEEKQEQKQAEDQFKELLTRVKEVLGDQIKEVDLLAVDRFASLSGGRRIRPERPPGAFAARSRSERADEQAQSGAESLSPPDRSAAAGVRCRTFRRLDPSAVRAGGSGRGWTTGGSRQLRQTAEWFVAGDGLNLTDLLNYSR